jgi:hypothetical protein
MMWPTAKEPIMAKQTRPDPRQHNSESAAHPGNLDMDDAASIDERWQEEELERTSMGWRGDDEEMPSTLLEVDELQRDGNNTEDIVGAADAALTGMKARAMRRGQFSTPGDDYDPGFDHGENAPKSDQLSDKNKREYS